MSDRRRPSAARRFAPPCARSALGVLSIPRWPRGPRDNAILRSLVVAVRLLGLALLVSGAGSCAGAEGTAEGVVIAVSGASLGQVSDFTIRQADGSEERFEVGKLDLTNGAFNADHLREHLLSAVPITVRFRMEDGRRVAYRLADASESGP